MKQAFLNPDTDYREVIHMRVTSGLLKTIFIAMAIILMGSLLLTCQKEGDDPIVTNNEVAFIINISNLNSASQLKSTMDYNLSDADKIILTIQNSDGSPTKYASSEVKIQQMNGDYYTQKIVLKTGTYGLTEFVIIDETDNTIFAAPLTGSQEAQNVTVPLPIEFSVSKDTTSYINVEVLSTEKKKPEDFGLNRFPIIEVKTFGFMIGVTGIEVDNLLTAKLTVSNGSYNYIQNLDSIANNIVTIKDGFNNYTLTVEKFGYKTYTHTYSIDSLIMFKDTTGNLPLIIELEKYKIPTGGLVAYYPLNGGANDESGNGNNGTTTNPNWSDHGIKGNCIQSINRGETYIQVPPSPSMNIITNQVSVSVWVYMFGSDYQNGQGNGAVVANKDYASDGSSSYGIFVGGSWAGKFQFITTTENGLVSANSPDDYVANVWYNITGVYNGIDMKLYVNGELISTELQTGNIIAGDFPFWMGKYCDGGSGIDWCYYGKIDEVCIYNRALNNQEIQALYNEVK
jgi:hypothetical protein